MGKQFGWLGNRFGRFTEEMFMPGLERILSKDFGLDTFSERIWRRQNGSSMDLDALSYSNSGKNTAVVVEIKTTLRDEDIKKFLDTLEQFPKFFPEHRDKKLYGMMAAAAISKEQKAVLESHGIYVVRISEDVVRLTSGKKFEPKDFSSDQPIRPKSKRSRAARDD